MGGTTKNVHCSEISGSRGSFTDMVCLYEKECAHPGNVCHCVMNIDLVWPGGLGICCFPGTNWCSHAHNESKQLIWKPWLLGFQCLIEPYNASWGLDIFEHNYTGWNWFITGDVPYNKMALLWDIRGSK